VTLGNAGLPLAGMNKAPFGAFIGFAHNPCGSEPARDEVITFNIIVDC
jgi:hypothetical protein